MNLVIVDTDFQKEKTVEQLRTLLGGQDTVVWFLDGFALQETGYALRGLTGLPEGGTIEKAVFLTRLTKGTMRYHSLLLKENPWIPCWIISILDVTFEMHKQQFLSAFDAALQGERIRYDILFDDSEKLEQTAAALKSDFGAGYRCVVHTAGEKELAEKAADVVRRIQPEWEVLCCPEDFLAACKTAERILLVGREAEDYLLPPVTVRTDRVYLWAEMPMGGNAKEARIQKAGEISKAMEAKGWDLSGYERRTLAGLLSYERLHCDLEEERISVQALRGSEKFVMWDEYGLPLPDAAYEDNLRMEEFLRENCCLGRLFEEAIPLTGIAEDF